MDNNQLFEIDSLRETHGAVTARSRSASIFFRIHHGHHVDLAAAESIRGNKTTHKQKSFVPCWILCEEIGAVCRLFAEADRPAVFRSCSGCKVAHDHDFVVEDTVFLCKIWHEDYPQALNLKKFIEPTPKACLFS